MVPDTTPETDVVVVLGNNGVGDNVFGIRVKSWLDELLVFGDDNTDELLNADIDEGETEDLCLWRFCSFVVSASW